MDTETKVRLTSSFESWRARKAEEAVARGTLQREMERAIAAGVSQADIARLFGVTRQAIHVMLKVDVR